MFSKAEISRLSSKELYHIIRRISSKRDNALNKRNELLKRFENFSVEQISKAFLFSNLQVNHPYFCHLLSENKPCHNIQTDKLNCFSCICPNYQIDLSFDTELQLFKIGKCSIKSKYTRYKKTQTKDENPKDYLILNCLDCSIPHNYYYVKKLIASHLVKSEIV